MKLTTTLSGRTVALTLLLTSCLFTCLLMTTAAGQQPPRPRPPRVEGPKPIGTMNGQPVTANDLILTVNTDSPFMPPLDGSSAPALQQFENQYPANPVATPTGPVLLRSRPLLVSASRSRTSCGRGRSGSSDPCLTQLSGR